MSSNRYHRQTLAFGDEGQRKIEASRVSVVGLGGIGSQIAQGLAYLGVGSFLLVDDDLVDTTNLNRLVGAGTADAEAKAPKVVVAERQIRQINPMAQVQSIRANLRARAVLEELHKWPILFGCVDHDGPRLIMMELAAAFEVVYIDAATEIFPVEGGPLDFGGRVVLARPGQYCLDCAQQIDMEQAKWELQSPDTREARRVHGYGLGEDNPAPAVVSLNGMIANLAITEFLCMTTGIREPNHHLTYHGSRGNVTIRTDQRRADCFTCGFLVGQHELANIFRYVAE